MDKLKIKVVGAIDERPWLPIAIGAGFVGLFFILCVVCIWRHHANPTLAPAVEPMSGPSAAGGGDAVAQSWGAPAQTPEFWLDHPSEYAAAHQISQEEVNRQALSGS